MEDIMRSIAGTTVLVCADDGVQMSDERAATDLVGTAMFSGAVWVALPTSRLTDDFFELRTRLAGHIAQKFVNYRVGLAIIGDISQHVDRSDALRDFVRESNRGTHLWFLPDIDALETRLTSKA